MGYLPYIIGVAMEKAQPIDYERDCKRCGKCCSPKFLSDENYIFLKGLRCKYLNDDNLCSVYDARKEIKGDTCLTVGESGIHARPVGCAFDGTAKEVDYTVEQLLESASIWFYGVLITGMYQWRQ
jgi:uncharacterized cysteine cluster protein YcgN (CxxCxxCC family)